MSENLGEILRKIVKQNEIIISLLGRMAFTPEEIRKIVTSKKKNPQKYIDGYNACDGKHSISDLAKIINVTTGTLSPILAEWEELGIIYEVERKGGKFYKKLYPI